MAETEARRRRPLVWPWVAGLAVAAVLVWLLSERFVAPSVGTGDGPPQPVRPPPVTAPLGAAPPRSSPAPWGNPPPHVPPTAYRRLDGAPTEPAPHTP